MEKTVLWAPLSYTANIVRPGKRAVTDMTVFEEMPVEIASVSLEEAPISMRWTGRPLPGDEIVSFDYRTYAGRCWRRARDFDGNPVDMAGFIAALRRLETEDVQSSSWVDFPWGDRRVSCYRTPLLRDSACRPAPREAIPVRKWISDDRDQIIAQARAISMEEILLIGGDVWLKSQEPGWIFEFSHHDEIEVHPWTPFQLNSPTRSGEIRFRADHLDVARRLIEARGKTARCVRDVEFEILRPDMLTFDERYFACRRFIDAMNHRCSRRDIREAPNNGLENLDAFNALVGSDPVSPEASRDAMALVRIMRDSNFAHVRDRDFANAVDEILYVDEVLSPTAVDDEVLALSLG